MLAISSPETVSFSDTSLLQMLSSHRRRPNLLIVNEGVSLGGVLEQLSDVSETPLTICRFPGHFDIEPDVKGTVVLGNIEHMTLGQQLMMMLTLMLTSKGVAGVPRAALVVLAATLTQFGLPLEGAAILLGIDQIMDMGRTAVNVMGNCIATAVVARWEGVLDDAQMRASQDGRATRVA